MIFTGYNGEVVLDKDILVTQSPTTKTAADVFNSWCDDLGLTTNLGVFDGTYRTTWVFDSYSTVALGGSTFVPKINYSSSAALGLYKIAPSLTSSISLTGVPERSVIYTSSSIPILFFAFAYNTYIESLDTIRRGNADGYCIYAKHKRTSNTTYAFNVAIMIKPDSIKFFFEQVTSSPFNINANIFKGDNTSDRTIQNSYTIGQIFDNSTNTLVEIGDTTGVLNIITTYDFDPITKTITKYNKDNDIIIIPYDINGVVVQHIAAEAFKDKKIRAVDFTLATGLLSIGDNAFTSATSVVGDVKIQSSLTLGVNIFGETGFETFYTTSGTYLYNSIQGWYMNPFTVERYEPSKINGFNKSSTTVIIPETIDGIEITSIYNSVFMGANLVHVEIPDTITTLGTYAFRGNSISTLVLGKGLTTIPYSAFDYNSLKTLVLPDNIKTIESSGFANNPITRITISDNVSISGNYDLGTNGSSFVPMYNANKVAGTYAYSGYPKFAWTKVAESPFIFDIPTKTITGYNISGGTAVNIPYTIDGVQVLHIAASAFRGMGLTSLSLAEGVLDIGEYCFAENPIKSIALPSTLTTIPVGAFQNCSIYRMSDLNYITTIEDYAFDGNGISTFILPDSVISLGKYTFSNNMIQWIELDTRFTEIPEGTFQNNELEEYVIPSHVTTLGVNCFKGNDLTKIDIPDTLLSIGDNCFEANPIIEITMPANRTLITDNTMGLYGASFNSCYALENNVRDTYFYNVPTNIWESTRLLKKSFEEGFVIGTGIKDKFITVVNSSFDASDASEVEQLDPKKSITHFNNGLILGYIQKVTVKPVPLVGTYLGLSSIYTDRSNIYNTLVFSPPHDDTRFMFYEEDIGRSPIFYRISQINGMYYFYCRSLGQHPFDIFYTTHEEWQPVMPDMIGIPFVPNNNTFFIDVSSMWRLDYSDRTLFDRNGCDLTIENNTALDISVYVRDDDYYFPRLKINCNTEYTVTHEHDNSYVEKGLFIILIYNQVSPAARAIWEQSSVHNDFMMENRQPYIGETKPYNEYLGVDYQGIVNIEYVFSQINDDYFFKYKIEDEYSVENYDITDGSPMTLFDNNGTLEIRIELSTAIRLYSSDLNGANISIINNTDKLVRFIVKYDDYIQSRINSMTYSGAFIREDIPSSEIPITNHIRYNFIPSGDPNYYECGLFSEGYIPDIANYHSNNAQTDTLIEFMQIGAGYFVRIKITDKNGYSEAWGTLPHSDIYANNFIRYNPDTTNGTLLLEVQSAARLLTGDNIATEVTLINTTDRTIDIQVYNDDTTNPRFNLVSATGAYTITNY